MKKLATALAAVLLLPAFGFGAPDKVGMVTDSGTIDDKSFNQGTWEGILKAKTDLKVDAKYLKPAGTTDADYVKEISNLYDAGYKFVVTPGFKFSGAIYTAQNKYKDAKFVIIDAAPAGPDGKTALAPNTVAIFFAEQESGFAAGVAAALQVKTGEFGFIGGMEIPPVQRYNWGFQQGVAYANANLGTKIVIKPTSVIYQGTFTDVAAGQQLAAQLYDKGVTVIFAAAGGVGVGVINEAKTRAAKGVWVIGVDVDQFSQGEYSPGKSIILTSAMKKIDQASYDLVKLNLGGKFPGGQILNYNLTNNGVGIPVKNPNLSDAVVAKVTAVLADVKAGKIKVAGEQGTLIK
jgi:basic membrane protein A